MAGIGQNIKRLRKAAGFKSQGEFADALKVKQPRLSDWENARYQEIKLGNVLKVAKALNVSVDELLVGLDPDYDRIIKASASTSARPPLTAEQAEALAIGMKFLRVDDDRMREGLLAALDSFLGNSGRATR